MAKNRRFEEKSVADKRTLGVRHLQCCLLFFGLSVVFTHRVNLSVAIVAMTDKNSTNPDFEEYNWDGRVKSYVLSSFFSGYCLPQIPAGALARKIGGKMLLLCGVFFSSVLAMLLPIAAAIGDWQAVVAVRFLQGVCQGLLVPSIHTLLSAWAPAEERGSLGTYCYAGSHFGTVIMLGGSGILASSFMGWPSVFYVPGAVGLIWTLVWWIWGASTPREYKNITSEELNLIEMSIAQHTNDSANFRDIPWKSIFTSLPLLMIIVSHCSFANGYWMLLTQMPTYMKSVMNMDIKKNALLSAQPYLFMLLMSFLLSAISEYLTRRKLLSVVGSRKTFNTIGFWIPAAALFGMGFVKKGESNLAVTLLTTAITFGAATHLGFQVNHIDLSPNFAGILMGITNSSANVMSFLAPLVVGIVITDLSDPSLWRIVFFLAAGIFFFGNLLFIMFGSAKVQKWNDNTHQPTQLTLVSSDANGSEYKPKS